MSIDTSAKGSPASTVSVCSHLTQPGAFVKRAYAFTSGTKVYLCSSCVANATEYAEITDIPFNELCAAYPEVAETEDMPKGWMLQKAEPDSNWIDFKLNEEE
ncbi:MAG: hypothetical protein ACK5JF_04005 [Oscillospiraceae bacterium]